MSEQACQATDPKILREMIMSYGRPKSEHEHWAARHIEYLEEKLAFEKAKHATFVSECMIGLNDLRQILVKKNILPAGERLDHRVVIPPPAEVSPDVSQPL